MERAESRISIEMIESDGERRRRGLFSRCLTRKIKEGRKQSWSSPWSVQRSRGPGGGVGGASGLLWFSGV